MDDPDQNKLQISILIINYNTRDLLERCIEVLKPNTFPSKWKLVVVDNASSDGSAEMVLKKYPAVAVVEMGGNLGFPKAVNRGIQDYPAEYYLILNSDTEVTQDNIKTLLEFMNDKPHAGAVTPIQQNKLGEIQLCWGDFPTLLSEAKRKKFQDALDRKNPAAIQSLKKFEKLFPADWIAGSTMLLRGETLSEAGLMDENIFIFFEDIDICTRIRREGWTIYVKPVVKVIHHRGESAKTEPFNASIHYRKAQLYFWNKYHGKISFLFLKFYLLLKFRLHFFKSIIKKNRDKHQFQFLKNAMKLVKNYKYNRKQRL
ncbi:MAG: glycosyltransferase family 2 protein [Acidobacteria bacterium]|nr:glycosyltransferase family 2 protein [Acidobacteriota bacterium]